MSDDEFCTQINTLTNHLGKLQVDGIPNVNTDQCVSKFIADEQVQLGRIVKPRRLEWVQELQFTGSAFTGFERSVASIACCV